jgi:heme exporter protein B
MSWVGTALAIVRKDLLLEWRGRSRSVSVLLFGVVTLLLFSFAVGPDTVALRDGAAGFLVLALLLSSTLGLSESFRLEQEDRAIEGLLLLPVDPVAIFYGKALGNTLLLLMLAPILVPIALVLYSVDSGSSSVLQLLLVWFLAAAGLSAPGTLYAAMTSRLRSQDVVLPVLLFPLVVPVLLGSVKAMALALSGDPMGQMRSWILLLAGFDVIYWSLCGVLFPFAIEEGQ